MKKFFENLEEYITKVVEDNVDQEIEEKVAEFRNQLLSRRSNYIKEIMKGFVISQQLSPETEDTTFLIKIENTHIIDERKVN